MSAVDIVPVGEVPAALELSAWPLPLIDDVAPACGCCVVAPVCGVAGCIVSVDGVGVAVGAAGVGAAAVGSAARTGPTPAMPSASADAPARISLLIQDSVFNFALRAAYS